MRYRAPTTKARISRELCDAKVSLPVSRQTIPFTQIPREVRDVIYDYVLNWPNTNHYKWARPSIPKPILHTPSIFLVNRQVSMEARTRLDRKRFLLCSVPRHLDVRQEKYDITSFISKATLQNIPLVTLRIESYPLVDPSWPMILHTLLQVWGEENRLKKLEVISEFWLTEEEVNSFETSNIICQKVGHAQPFRNFIVNCCTPVGANAKLVP